MTKAETVWREKSANVQADLAARCERAEKALSEVRSKPSVRMSLDEVENRRLRQEIGTLRAALTERDTQLSRMRSDADQALEAQRRAQEAALSSAMSAWKDAEAARMSAAEAQWRKQSDASLAAVTKKCDRAELALVELRAQFETAARSAENEVENRLRGELANLRTALAEREIALAQARSNTEQLLQHARQASDEALAHEQLRWKNDEATRLAAAEAQWRAESLGDDNEDRRLRAELASVHAVLADRDAALAQTRLTAERALNRVQQESETALANAQASWKTEESARLSAAEAQWRTQSANALAEATARFKEAETALAQIRVRGVDKDESAVVTRLRSEVEMLQSALADHDDRSLRSAPTHERRETSASRIAIRENHDWQQAEPREKKTNAPRHRLIRDVVVVAVLAASAIIFWPRFEAYIPAGWLPGSADSELVASQARAPAPAVASTPPESMTTVVRSANVRADPAKAAIVIATVQRGMQVAIIDQRENWTLIRIEGTKPQQGWVYSSFLKTVKLQDKALPASKR